MSIFTKEVKVGHLSHVIVVDLRPDGTFTCRGLSANNPERLAQWLKEKEEETILRLSADVARYAAMRAVLASAGYTDENK